MKKFLFILFFILFKQAFSNTDSLKSFLEKIIDPVERCSLLIDKGYQYYHQNPQITFVLNKYADSLCSIYLKQIKPDSLILLKHKADALNNLGFLYLNKGKIETALEFYYKSLKIREQIQDFEGLATSYNSIGSIYSNQGELEKAKDFFEKSLAMRKILGAPQGIAYTLNNIGYVYEQKKDVLNARKYYLESRSFIEQTKDSSGIASVYNNIGWSYHQTQNYDSALFYYSKSNEIGEKIGDKTIIAFALSNSGKVYYELKHYNKALLYTQKALQIAKEQGFPETIRNASSILSQIYAASNDYKNAYEMHLLFKQMADSLKNQEIEKKLITEKMLYDFDKEKALLEAEREKNKLLAEAKNKEKNIILLFSMLGGVSLITFSWLQYKRLIITRKQNKIIEQQKLLLEEKNALVEEKNKDITDSINYAKRIQDAVLQKREHVSKHLPEHFIFFQPRDIVSGDFYWAFEKKGYLYFAVADCTGHGVPGAFMSLLGITFLNEICKNDAIQKPAEILELLREKIIHQLNHDNLEKTNSDGIDIALCRLNLNSNELVFSGANNPCWIIKNNNSFMELKPEKQPVGFHVEYKPFSNQEIVLNKGDLVYLFSDGYADQFGGERGKKIKYSTFKEKIKEASTLEIMEQKSFLKNFFNNWKGHLEQVDDVTVLGLKV